MNLLRLRRSFARGQRSEERPYQTWNLSPSQFDLVAQFAQDDLSGDSSLAGGAQVGKSGCGRQARVGGNSNPVFGRLADQGVGVLLFSADYLRKWVDTAELADYTLIQVERAVFFKNGLAEGIFFNSGKWRQRGPSSPCGGGGGLARSTAASWASTIQCRCRYVSRLRECK